ncbi:cytidine deaminase-like protein, partial [Basidiobolus meristosporus CBS 931.73]
MKLATYLLTGLALSSGSFFPLSSATEPSRAQIIENLRRAQEVALRAVGFGKHPFGAILVAADHTTVLIEQGNVNTVNHAEAVLSRIAAENFPPGYLWNTTLYTTVEPCAMCAATQYWANIGRVVFGVEESDLLAITGNNAENPTLSVPSR